MKKKTFLQTIFVLILSTAITSCKKSNKEQSLEAKTMLNVSYGSSSLQNMDVYLPANRNTETKVVVFVHGGSFIGGDKGELLPTQVLELGYRYTGYEVSVANKQHYKAISPLHAANANQKVPTLNIFPQNNAVAGLPKQDRATFDAFTNKLNQIGVPNKFVQIPGADHSFTTAGSIQLLFVELLAYLNVSL